MENQNQISFILRKISTEQFAIIESAFDSSKDNIEMENSARFGFNLDRRIITALLSVNFKQEKGPFLLLEIGCHFEIIEEHWKNLYHVDKHEIQLPLALARHLVVLAMGTLRGVLHAKTENTPFNIFFLPTINVTDIVKEDVIIKTNDSKQLE
jgi:hypothetical protein